MFVEQAILTKYYLCNTSTLFIFPTLLIITISYLGFFSNKPYYFLVIGILSDRDHFHQRDVIRQTWLKEIATRKDRVGVKFIVGRRGCVIPPAYRLDDYSCKDEGQWGLPIDFGNEQEYDKIRNDVPCNTIAYSHQYHSVAIDFRVRHPVVVTSLAIPSGYCNMNASVQVELRDLTNEDQLVLLATFTSDDCIAASGCFIQKGVPHFHLPHNFEGSLVVRCPSEDASRFCLGVEGVGGKLKSPSHIYYRPLLRYSIDGDLPLLIRPTSLDQLFFPAYLIHHLFDIGAFQHQVANRITAFRYWHDHVVNVDRRLAEESREYDDIMYVGDSPAFPDVYRNLPRKVLSFFSKSHQLFNYDFIGKVDDDAYVNISNIVKELENPNNPVDGVWLGNFRHFVPVERWGKWAELDYPSFTYPAFACGSGYVVSRDISAWLSTNENHLRTYQGEDVSMAIWLSSIKMDRKQMDRFVCDSTCRVDMMTSAQHNSSTLLRLWSNSRICGNPCSCRDL